MTTGRCHLRGRHVATGDPRTPGRTRTDTRTLLRGLPLPLGYGGIVTQVVTWSAPVRYAEVDQQGIVFNAHYLTYCDEAMGAFCDHRGILGFAERLNLVSSSLTWSGPARWGDTIEVDATCTRIGSTSVTMRFQVRAAGRDTCVVETVYVHVGDAGRPTPVPEDVRRALQD